MKSFNCVETITILVSKQSSSNSFKSGSYRKINIIDIMYNYLNVCKQMTDVKLLLLHCNTWNHLTVGKQKWAQAHLKM